MLSNSQGYFSTFEYFPVLGSIPFREKYASEIKRRRKGNLFDTIRR